MLDLRQAHAAPWPMADYSAHLVKRVTLRDGREVTIRPVRRAGVA